MSPRKAVPGKQNFGLYVYRGKKRDTYWVRREAAGKPDLDERLAADNLNEARREGAERVREWLGLKPKVKVVQLIKELWPPWVDTKADKSQATRDSINYSWKRLEPFIGNMLPSEIIPNTFEEYIRERRKTDPDQKFENDWKWLNMFMLHLHKNGLVEKRPELRNPDPETDAGIYLESEQVMDLVIYAEVPKMHAKIVVSATTGMRKREIEFIAKDGALDSRGRPLSFFSREKRAVWLRAEDTKIRKARWVPLPSDAFTELEYLDRRARGTHLFPADADPNRPAPRNSDKKTWTTCRRLAGVECRFHDLRHTYLTNAFKNARGKVDAMLICEAAGLSIEQAQKTYLHFDLDDLRVVTELVTLIEAPRPSLDSRESVGSFRVKAGEIVI